MYLLQTKKLKIQLIDFIFGFYLWCPYQFIEFFEGLQNAYGITNANVIVLRRSCFLLIIFYTVLSPIIYTNKMKEVENNVLKCKIKIKEKV